MVALTVTPSKGNAGARYYPHSGHLGLTPVKVEGVVRTRVEEDGKPATASAVTVSLRCYEARVGRVGVVKSNILVEQSLTLWSPPSGAVWGSLGATELPFKIVLPANAAGNSTFSLQEYRVYWRIEAAIHTPHIPGIGTRQVKCFDVNLVRYNKPSTSTLPRRAALARPSEVHNSAHYELEFPRQSAAPLDPIPVSLRIHPRHGTSVQRVTFALERRIDMFDASPASSMQQLPSPGPLMRQISRESSPSESSTTLACSSSTTALLPASPREERPTSSRKRSPSPASQGLAAKTAELVLATAEVADIPKEGVPLQDGLCTVNASLQVPLPKSNAHWGVGETMQGGLARVRFYITAKVRPPGYILTSGI
ncbi:hypothetical protein BDV93DRAFT_430987 [Ceratobasidium sp. AG-I]|nr:hypothetical protein BDV93DRAFT_430987 [Ceratobasidium sp. AG-I]